MLIAIGVAGLGLNYEHEDKRIEVEYRGVTPGHLNIWPPSFSLNRPNIRPNEWFNRPQDTDYKELYDWINEVLERGQE